MRLKLILAYDGSAFAGWQSQRAANGVQDFLEAAVARIAKVSGIRVQGSGRTDAGVHALGQVAHFDSPPDSRMDPAAWLRALNANLPPTLRVLRCAEAAPAFHARFDATGKTYAYRICTAAVMPPLENGRAWHVPQQMGFEMLAATCREVEGRHDFAAFAANRGDADHGEPGYAVRTIWQVRPERCGDILTITFHGEGFLYKMVRLLVGSLVRVARGQETLEWFRDLLTAHSGRTSSYVAPAEGLYLVKVDYSTATAAGAITG